MKRILLAMVLWASAVHAQTSAEGESRTTATPEDRKYGAYLALGNPYPSLIGINAAYNIDDNWRASIGYGEVEATTSVAIDSSGNVSEQKVTAQTYSAGVDYLFLDTIIRPVVGARAGYFSVSGQGDFSIQGINKSTALLYSSVGADWLAKNGFNIGTGLNIAMLGGHGVNFYANVGYFF